MRGEDGSGSGLDAGCREEDMPETAAVCRYTTPSSSRRYPGPIFLFSALHCAMTRSRRRFVMVQPVGSEVASRGSEGVGIELSGAPGADTRHARVVRFSLGTHHHPIRSTPPS